MANIKTSHWAGLNCQRLTLDNVSQACHLSREANWNQNARDWSYMIASGHGWGLFDTDARLVATAIALPQQPGTFGWISMVLVAKDWQRRGLAGKLLETCIANLLDQGLTPGLDATESGRPIYLPLGFRDVYSLTRMERMDTGACHREDAGIKAIGAIDLPGISAIDQSATGCDRSNLLEHLHGRAPQLAWMSTNTNGFCFGRDGINAHQLGPVIADDANTAIDLAAMALRHLDGRVFIDVPDHQEKFVKGLASLGFKPQRSFIRMLHQRTQPFDVTEKIFAIAGPEIG